ncbi:MAG: TRAP transporter TatT component family protein [Proteobacteria bacterium]|nr:TRAP transporter TatT component family protein [Pseudomonadota bacterium]
MTLTGLKAVAAIPILLMVCGCASMLNSVTQGLASDLSAAILDNPDVDVVREGAPAYLILIDGLLQNSPDNVDLLLTAASLNGAYAAAFISDENRARLMADKARSQAMRAACVAARGCDLATIAFVDFEHWVAARTAKDVVLIHGLGSAWAGWIQANSDDFNAIAELARVKLLMQRLIELDERYDYGAAHLYMGVFETLLPPALGGRPEIGRVHFEKAVQISGGRHLLTKVMYADQYGRLVFDRELHDRLLREVLASDPRQPGLTLINTVAQQRAVDLLETADDYF